MFQLTRAEFDSLKSQVAMSSGKHRGAAYRLYAFTEHGALQAANVLRSPRAVQMSVSFAAGIHVASALAIRVERQCMGRAILCRFFLRHRLPGDGDAGERNDPGGSLGIAVLTEGRLERQFPIGDLG